MWGVKLELEVARQMYELAVRREENRLTAKDKEILGMIEIPNSQTLKIIYRVSLERSDALNTLNDFIAGRNLPWVESAMHFLEMYYDQKENGMTHEIEIAMCEWARSKNVPIQAVRLITRHNWEWSVENLNPKKARINYG